MANFYFASSAHANPRVLSENGEVTSRVVIDPGNPISAPSANVATSAPVTQLTQLPSVWTVVPSIPAFASPQRQLTSTMLGAAGGAALFTAASNATRTPSDIARDLEAKWGRRVPLEWNQFLKNKNYDFFLESVDEIVNILNQHATRTGADYRFNRWEILATLLREDDLSLKEMVGDLDPEKLTVPNSLPGMAAFQSRKIATFGTHAIRNTTEHWNQFLQDIDPQLRQVLERKDQELSSLEHRIVNEVDASSHFAPLFEDPEQVCNGTTMGSRYDCWLFVDGASGSRAKELTPLVRARKEEIERRKRESGYYQKKLELELHVNAVSYAKGKAAVSRDISNHTWSNNHPYTMLNLDFIQQAIRLGHSVASS